MSVAQPALQVLGFVVYLAGATGAIVAAASIVRTAPRGRCDTWPMVVALASSAVWAALCAALGPGDLIPRLVAPLRDLAWLFVIYRLFANDGRSHTQIAVPLLVSALGFVALLVPVVELAALSLPQARAVAYIFHVLVAFGALVLLHNLYLGAADQSRLALQWTIAGIGMYWIFELNMFLSAALSGEVGPLLDTMRGLAILPLAACVALGATGRADTLRLHTSRAVTFRVLSLALIGVYLCAMAGLTWLAAWFGTDFAPIVQIAFLVAASAASVALLPSRGLRGWTRVMLLKHLFRHRYDYRAEWLRFTRTIGDTGLAGDRSFHQRVATSLANITESPAAVLFLPDEEDGLAQATDWRWPNLAEGGARLPPALCTVMERRGRVVELDNRHAHTGQGAAVPQWLEGEGRAWAIVPLMHFDRLTGAVLLARPAISRALDWEDFDLLTVVGRQLASYLAEEAGQRALMEARQFDDFNRRIAFVVHDIKNLASQLSLLARNAQTHADNPDFRRDMLVTLRAGSDRLQALLARLGRYGVATKADCVPFDLLTRAQDAAARFAVLHPVLVTGSTPCPVTGNPAALDQAIVHLIQNAIDASASDDPVMVDVRMDERGGTLEVVDTGPGMTSDFVRDGLFRPFVSSKPGGFGIGALEARELVAAMGGTLLVQSRPGVGSRFAIVLPRAEVGAAPGAKEAA